MDEILKEAFDCFILECDERIEEAVSGLLALEKSPDPSTIDSVFRAFHTIKGNSRMFELSAVPELAHAAESLMAAFRGGGLKPDRPRIDLLLSALDAIRDMLSSVAAGKSEPEPGGRLAQTLREAAIQTAAPEKPKPPSPIKVEPRAPRPQLSILVVEDDFASRRLMERMLGEYGRVEIAADGEEAVEAFTQAFAETAQDRPPKKPYDLVCIDLMMPKMDGFEAVRTIRDLEMADTLKRLAAGSVSVGSMPHNDAVILVATSLDDPGTYIRACYHCGANGYLVKPISKEKLVAELARFGLA